MNKWATIQILAINPNTTLIRSPGVSNTDQIVSTWGVLTPHCHDQKGADEDGNPPEVVDAGHGYLRAARLRRRLTHLLLATERYIAASGLSALGALEQFPR